MFRHSQADKITLNIAFVEQLITKKLNVYTTCSKCPLLCCLHAWSLCRWIDFVDFSLSNVLLHPHFLETLLLTFYRSLVVGFPLSEDLINNLSSSSFSFGLFPIRGRHSRYLHFYDMAFVLQSDALPATNPLFRRKT